jgi:hypothetical protein
MQLQQMQRAQWQQLQAVGPAASERMHPHSAVFHSGPEAMTTASVHRGAAGFTGCSGGIPSALLMPAAPAAVSGAIGDAGSQARGPGASLPARVRCVDVLLIHEATMDDERAHDAAAKKHSTVGGALCVGRRIAAGLRDVEARLRHCDARSAGRSASGGAGGAAFERDSGASGVQLAGCILTHFSQRYPKLPPQAAAAPAAPPTRSSEAAGTSSAATNSSAAGSSAGGRNAAAVSSTAGVGAKRRRAHDERGTANPSTSGESKARKETEDGLFDDTPRDEVADRCLFAFDAMVIPLIPAPQLKPSPVTTSTAACAAGSSGGASRGDPGPLTGACDGRTEWPDFDAASDIHARIRRALAPEEDAAP